MSRGNQLTGKTEVGKFHRIWSKVLENLIRSHTAIPGIQFFAKGPAIIINIICLNHYSAPWFSKHYEDGMVINDRRILSCFGLFLSATSPPSAPSFWTSLNPQQGRGVYLFSTRLPHCLLLFALKGTNSIHSCDIKALIQ